MRNLFNWLRRRPKPELTIEVGKIPDDYKLPMNLHGSYLEARDDTRMGTEPPVVNDEDWEKIRMQAIVETFKTGKPITGSRRLPEDVDTTED